ncbi:hypothetical protein CP10139811_1023 [Chlamydia ibidis]|uniref:Uncharacterized protein n=2 Tax=Chlamydia ibidis TaxID=1405396 RepID=S7J560_9CHLA|nr:hypothetical protein [Chlamydia ibidis]EPP35348.1 hypothetical protein CP10139811_1023 [Chlamydia ibidis]EQM63029.1 hypothetical protein H359_0341 [Chlamydia ibidis 10-1398/6]
MVKKTYKLYLLQCLLCALHWLIYYCKKLIREIPSNSDDPLVQAFLASLVDVLSNLKKLPYANTK